MSTQSVGAHALHRTGRPSSRVVPVRQRALRMVPQRRSSAPRAPFVVVVVALLAAGLLGLLVLNTVLAQDAFRLHVLQKQGMVLAGQELSLQREVEARRAPGNLAARATELGLVAGGPPAFLRLSDGVVLGQAGPAGSPAPQPLAAPGLPGLPGLPGKSPAPPVAVVAAPPRPALTAPPVPAVPTVPAVLPTPAVPVVSGQPLPRKPALPRHLLPLPSLPRPALPRPALLQPGWTHASTGSR